MLHSFFETVFAAKNSLVTASGLTRDGLHVHISVLLLLLFALPFRRKLASVWPFLLVLLAEVVNEWGDYRLLPVSPVPAYFWPEVAKDIVNSMLLPFLFFILARYMPWWLGGLPKRDNLAELPNDEAA